MNVSDFRERCLSLFEHLPADGVIVTKRGKPIAKVIPIRSGGADLIGSLAGVLEIHGDILTTGEKWDAES